MGSAFWIWGGGWTILDDPIDILPELDLFPFNLFEILDELDFLSCIFFGIFIGFSLFQIKAKRSLLGAGSSFFTGSSFIEEDDIMGRLNLSFISSSFLSDFRDFSIALSIFTGFVLSIFTGFILSIFTGFVFINFGCKNIFIFGLGDSFLFFSISLPSSSSPSDNKRSSILPILIFIIP